MRDPHTLGKAALAAVVLALHGGCLLALDARAPRATVVAPEVVVEARFIAPRIAVAPAPSRAPMQQPTSDPILHSPPAATDVAIAERIDEAGAHAMACRRRDRDAPLAPDARHDGPISPHAYADRATRDRCARYGAGPPDS